MSKTATRTTMKVKESEARALLRALNSPGNAEGTIKRLTTKLNELPRWAAMAEPPADPDMLELFDKLNRAAEDGEQIEVVPDAELEPAPPEEEDAKPALKKKGGKKPKPVPKEKGVGPSAKQRVYKMWAKSKDKGTGRAEHYFNEVGQAVQLSTIKGWVSAWGRGQNLPAGAK